MEALTIDEFISALEYAFLAGKREKDFNEWFKKAYGRNKNFKMPNNAIAFAEWLTQHAYKNKSEDKEWSYRLGSCYYPSDHKEVSIEKLYQQFIEEQLKRK